MKIIQSVLFSTLCGILLTVASAVPQRVFAQSHYAIYTLQGADTPQSPYIDQEVETEGVVTLTLFGEAQLNGFFLQDTLGDGNPLTSDAIFVYGKQNVKVGDYVKLTGTVGEYKNRTQLSKIKNLQVLKDSVAIPFTKVRFEEDVQGREEALECMALEFVDTLHLLSTRSLTYGSVILGTTRHRSPTDYNLPKSEAYEAAVAYNRSNRITLNYGGTGRPSSTPFLDKDGTCRTGNMLTNFRCVLDQVDREYQVYAQSGTPDFKGNPRTAAPNNAKLGDYDTKICGFNLEYFMNRDALQRTRISKAIRAIDADIYGFVEVGGGTGPVRALVEELDKQRGAGTYDFVRWNGYASASADYTCNHIVYDSTKWEPYRDNYMISAPSPVNRKLIQAFRNKKTGFVFIFSINHFKAKSGTGTGADADQGDGQGIYNATRTREANAVLDRLDLLRYYYGTEKILVMGDLNAMYCEDPIRVFTNKGYENQTNRFDEAEYSYCFDDYVQYLDYSLASPDMRELVTGATVWHINSDEPSFFDYDRDETRQDGPYRCSDHEPVIVGFVSPAPSSDTVITANASACAASLLVRPNPASDHFTFYTPQAGRLEVRSVSGAVIRKIDVGAGENTLEVSSWKPGLYFLVLCTEKGEILHGKLVKI